MNRRNFIRAGLVALALTTGLARSTLVLTEEPSQLDYLVWFTPEAVGAEGWARLMTGGQLSEFLRAGAPRLERGVLSTCPLP